MISEQLIEQIKEYAVHGAYPNKENSNHFYVPAPYISPAMKEWHGEVEKYLDGIKQGKVIMPFKKLKENFGGLFGIWPGGYEEDKLFFHADYADGDWEFKQLIPRCVQEEYVIEIESLADKVANFLPYFMVGPKREPQTMSVPGLQKLFFNTREEQ